MGTNGFPSFNTRVSYQKVQFPRCPRFLSNTGHPHFQSRRRKCRVSSSRAWGHWPTIRFPGGSRQFVNYLEKPWAMQEEFKISLMVAPEANRTCSKLFKHFTCRIKIRPTSRENTLPKKGCRKSHTIPDTNLTTGLTWFISPFFEDGILIHAWRTLELAGTRYVVFAQACQIYPSRRCKGRPQNGQHKRFVKQWQNLNESESSIGHLLNRLPLSASKTSIWIHTGHERAMNMAGPLHLGSDDCVPVSRRWGRGTQINWAVIGISCTNGLELSWKQACYSNNFRNMNTDPQTMVNPYYPDFFGCGWKVVLQIRINMDKYW